MSRERYNERTYEEYLHLLTSGRDILIASGIKKPGRGDRLDMTISVIEELVGIARSGAPFRRSDDEYFNILFEADELVRVLDAVTHFGHSSHGRAKKALKGSLISTTDADQTSRNFGFELSFAALGQKFSVPTSLPGNTDVLLTFSGREIYSECKRPQSISSMQRNIESASKQVESAADSDARRKLVVVDATFALNQPFRVHRAPTRYRAYSRTRSALRGEIGYLIDDLHNRRKLQHSAVLVRHCRFARTSQEMFVVTYWALHLNPRAPKADGPLLESLTTQFGGDPTREVVYTDRVF